MLLVGNTQNELDDTEAHSDLARGDVVEEGLSLRGKARTVDHLLTHLPTAPLCEACVRGNMTRKRAHTKKPDDNTAVPTTLGDQVAADHLVANRIVSHGINRSAYAVVFWGIGTRYVDSYPGGDKRAAEARPALQVLIGPRQSVRSFQCGVAKELYTAAIELALCPSPYRPYVPQPNFIAERQIRHVEESTRTPSLSSAALHRHGGLTRRAGSAQPPMPQHKKVHRHGRRGIIKDLLPGLRVPFGSLIDLLSPLPHLKIPTFVARAVPWLLLRRHLRPHSLLPRGILRGFARRLRARCEQPHSRSPCGTQS